VAVCRAKRCEEEGEGEARGDERRAQEVEEEEDSRRTVVRGRQGDGSG